MRFARPNVFSRPALALGFAASVFAGALGPELLGACANPDTQTPMCDNNVNANGIMPDPNGCDQFPTCLLGAAINCCTGDGGATLTGNDLETCLYGYGDPSCPYLQITYVQGTSGIEMNYKCVTSPPDGGNQGTGGTGGGGAGGSTSSSSSTSSTTSSSGDAG